MCVTVIPRTYVYSPRTYVPFYISQPRLLINFEQNRQFHKWYPFNTIVIAVIDDIYTLEV